MYMISDRTKKENTSYADMIKLCCTDLILNNDIMPQLEKSGFYFDIYCGDIEDEETGEFIDIYQQYIIDRRDAESIKENTNEIIMFNEELDLYLLCVTHYGTSWNYIPATWKFRNNGGY